MQRKLIEKKEAEVEPLRVLLLLMQRKPSEKKATEGEPLRVLVARGRPKQLLERTKPFWRLEDVEVWAGWRLL